MVRFSKFIWLYVCISAFILVPGMYTLLRFGLRPSIDFAGGTLLEIRSIKPLQDAIINSSAKAQKIEISSIARSGESTYILRMKQTPQEQLVLATNDMASRSATSVSIVRSETVGPILGQELLAKATVAALLAITSILLYVAYAFKNIRFGVAAIIALLHDLLVVLGMFALFGRWWGVEVDTLFVTAFLTTMSFSVHDTIVVFDRIREYIKRDRSRSLEEICDIALTETMNRSLTNSLTIIFMLLALVLMGGESIKWFVVALLVGTVSGTYSSAFVATPVIIFWHRLGLRKHFSKPL